MFKNESPIVSPIGFLPMNLLKYKNKRGKMKAKEGNNLLYF